MYTVFVLWLMHSDAFKSMENRGCASEKAHISECVYVQLHVSGDQLHFRVVLQMRHSELHADLHKVFSLLWQLLCLASKEVTQILILDKQIATDSLTGQNLQVNRIKNNNIDSIKQIATN